MAVDQQKALEYLLSDDPMRQMVGVTALGAGLVGRPDMTTYGLIDRFHPGGHSANDPELDEENSVRLGSR